MAAMLPLMAILEQGRQVGQCIKQGMTLRALPAGPPRKPLSPLNSTDQNALAQVIREMDSKINAIVAE